MCMRTIDRKIVGSILLSRDGLVLLGFKDKSNGGQYSDCWVIPGGGVKDGESEIEALYREIQEEVGLDISAYPSTLVDSSLTGEAEKVQPNTGERVIARMRFYDYLTRIPVDANNLRVQAADDLAEVKWMNRTDLSKYPLSPSTKELLTKQNLL